MRSEPGPASCAALAIDRRAWCCSGTRPARAAAPLEPRWARFTVPPTSASTLTWAFFATWPHALGLRATLRRLTSSRTKWVITCRRCSASPRKNQLSVLLELQADCFAGIWGHAAKQRGILEPGDVEEGLRAAAAVGDDRLQKAATGRVSPESFTHGSAAQRAQWFRRGMDSGRIEDCDTFAGSAP